MMSPEVVAAQKLQCVEKSITEIERVLADDPSDIGTEMTLGSLVELRDILRADLAAMASGSLLVLVSP